MAAARSSPRLCSISCTMPSMASSSFWSSFRASSTCWSPSTTLVAAKRSGMPAATAWSSIRCMMLCRQRCTAPPWSSLSQKSCRRGRSWYFATCRACSTSSSMPSFLAAEMGSTGMPSMRSISFTRTVPPLLRISSIMFRASTMGVSSSISCMVRYRLRSMLPASTMLMMPWGCCSKINSRLTISSSV